MKKNDKKKGFTLVELLVVIAILAILASVSVVGYLSFTEKAKKSKCETEALQVREVINGHLMDGKVLKVTDNNQVTYVAKLENNELTVKKGTDITTGETLTGEGLDTAIKTLFTDLAGLDKTGTVEFSFEANKFTYSVDGYKCNITFDGNPLEAVK